MVLIKNRKRILIFGLVVLAVLGLHIGKVYRDSLRYEIVLAANECGNIDGVHVTIERPECSRVKYLLTGTLLTYTLTNGTEQELLVSPKGRIEYQTSDGTWVYHQQTGSEGTVVVPSTLADYVAARSTTESVKLSEKNVFVRWAYGLGKYRLAVDYSVEETNTDYTVYAEFSIS